MKEEIVVTSNARNSRGNGAPGRPLRFEYRQEVKMKAIAVLDEKGGVGKTTVATHLAAFAHMQGLRTILLDCNARQGSASQWCLRRPATSSLQGLECQPVRGSLTLAKLASLAGDMQVAVLDGMPYLGPEAKHAAVCSDLVVIPVRPGQYDLEAVQQTHEALDRADEVRLALGLPKLQRQLVLTQSVQQGLMEQEALTVLHQSPWGEVAGVLRFRQAFARTASTGETVWQLGRNAHTAQEEATAVAQSVLGALGLLTKVRRGSQDKGSVR